jgi:chromate transport protein ChrA
MKDILYSLTVSTILLIIMFILAYKFWSISFIIICVLFYVFYFERAREWRKFRKQQNIKK